MLTGFFYAVSGLVLAIVLVVLWTFSIMRQKQSKIINSLTKTQIPLVTMWENFYSRIFLKEHAAHFAYRKALDVNFKPFLGFLFKFEMFTISDAELAKKVSLNWKTYEKILPPTPNANQVLGTNVVFSNSEIWRKQRTSKLPAFH
jgi:hypothetical protein